MKEFYEPYSIVIIYYPTTLLAQKLKFVNLSIISKIQNLFFNKYNYLLKI